jgi:hypothetical protein
VVEIGLSAACVQSQAASRALRRRRRTASTSSVVSVAGATGPSALPGDDPVAGAQIGQRAVALVGGDRDGIGRGAAARPREAAVEGLK